MSNHHEADISDENVQQETKPICDYCNKEISNMHEVVFNVADNATYHNNGCLKKYDYVQIVEDCLVDHECTTETCSNITLKMKMER